MAIFKLNQNTVITYMVGGLFSAASGWQHTKKTLKSDYELVVCTSGPIFLQFGDNQEVINSGDIIVIPPFTTFSGSSPSPNKVEFYWLHFILPKETTLSNQRQNELIPIDSRYHISNLDSLLIVTNQLLAVDQTDIYRQQEQNLIMTLLLTQISNHSKRGNADNQSAILINRMKEWIRLNINKHPSLDDLSKESGLNPQYLSRMFKHYVGMSPKKYMVDLKVKTAQTLLIKTNLSIKEISSYSYFTDEKLFMKQFKNHVGVTPSGFRASYKSIYHNTELIDPELPIPKDVLEIIKNNSGSSEK
ncbi:AraC family transcriptional regulator [Lentilactobacillus sp. Marseille-Q4993]|uniref:AraC family transcriptional regulator n=1 Tax=Lentilactobacillus sp. Marseille-Q4993 TaxID=3039492 RepID=UPI0024BBFEA2|nr:AraC family transcriptional regulator [Lentilactobacillus sp. Marseille-Q4993]